MDAALTTSAVRDMQLKHLMDSYGSQIVRVCYTYLKDAALAEDAAQDTFVKAYRHLGHAWNVEHEKAQPSSLRAGRLFVPTAQGKISFCGGKSLAITIVYDIIKLVACFPAEQT